MTWKPVTCAGRVGILLLSTAIGWQPSAAQKTIEADGPYPHRAAAAVFPVGVGEFRRAQIHQYDDSGRDVSASYNFVTPNGRLLITVYIYPAPRVAESERNRLCAREFESAKDAIRKQHGPEVAAEKGRAVDIAGTRKERRHRAVFRVTMNFDGQAQPVRSEAHLYCYVDGDWFVKYRISAPIAVTAPGAVEAFIRTGPWPGRGSPETMARLEPARGRGTPLPTQR